MIGVNCAVGMQSALKHRTNSADKMLGRISTPVAEYANNPRRLGTRCWLNNYFLIAAREPDDASRHLPSHVRCVSHRSFRCFSSLIPKYHFAYSLNPCAARNSFSVCADGRCSLHASLSSNTKRPTTMSSLANSNAVRFNFTAMMLSHMRGRKGRLRCSTSCERIDLFLFARPAFPTITRLSEDQFSRSKHGTPRRMAP
jgi:hypothetical protein